MDSLGHERPQDQDAFASVTDEELDRLYHPFADDDASPSARGVEQQFTGSGVPALTESERRNRRARRTVSVLAALVVLLVVVPAILLITPNAFRGGYGVAPHTAIATVVSTAIPPVADSPTPTPTVGPGSSGATNPAPHPTATPRPLPTATPRPKPTATPTPQPTATVNPYGAAATVSFTRTAQPINVPQTMTACNGCGISTANGGTIPAQYNNPTVLYHPAQWPLTYVTNYGAYNADPYLVFTCFSGLSPNCPTFPSGTTVYPPRGATCILQNQLPTLAPNGVASAYCLYTVNGYACFNLNVAQAGGYDYVTGGDYQDC